MFALAAGLAACGRHDPSLSAKELHRIRTVAIISALGQTLSFEKVGQGPFEWFEPPDTRYLEISDWKIDDAVTREIAAALAPHFAIKTSHFTVGDFSAWNYASLRKQIFLLNDDPNIDAYVVVLRDWRGDEIGNSVHDVQGLGLYRRDTSGGERSGVFASYRIVVIDANTGDIYATRRGELMGKGKLPWAPAASSLWPATPNDLTDAQRRVLGADISRLIDETLPRTLASLKLTD